MVAPILAGILGLAGGGLAGTLLSGNPLVQSGEYHAPYEHYQYSPTVSTQQTYSPAQTYNAATTIIMNSPNTNVENNPILTAISRVAQNQKDLGAALSQSESEGTNMVTLAIIGAVAVIGYGLVSNPPKKRK